MVEHAQPFILRLEYDLNIPESGDVFYFKTTACRMAAGNSVMGLILMSR
jgi:hypothetical protein